MSNIMRKEPVADGTVNPHAPVTQPKLSWTHSHSCSSTTYHIMSSVMASVYLRRDLRVLLYGLLPITTRLVLFSPL